MIYYKEAVRPVVTPKKCKDKKNLSKTYIENVVSFDTETTSGFIDNKGNFEMFDENKNKEYINYRKHKKNAKKVEDYYADKTKVGFVYIWMVAVDNNVYYGRTLEECKEFFMMLNTDAKGEKIVIYVHNLGFDFQFLRNIFEFDNLFARKERETLRADIRGTNITLKCSYALASLSLEQTAKIHNLDVEKAVGDLDYNIARNSKTVLTEEELHYCENDVLVINAFIKKMLEEYGTHKNIPMTSTGIVRKAFKDHIKANYKNGSKYALMDWMKRVARLTEDTTTFELLVKVFAGGYTHANAFWVGRVVENVQTIDFTSDYPAVLLSFKFPSSTFWIDTNVQLYHDSLFDFDTLDYENRAYILTLKFTNIDASGPMNYISLDKCKSDITHFAVDNGRVASADTLTITCTEQDYLIIKENYTFDKMELLEARSAEKDYIPKVYYTFILKIYQEKQDLKQEKKKVESKYGSHSKEYYDIEAKYNRAKARLNSLFGMACTNYICDDVYYENEEWKKDILDEMGIQEKLMQMRTKPITLLPYSVGVWCTAYARKILWIMIKKLGNDIVYCDTDSCKYVGNHDKEVNEYNVIATERLKTALKHYDLPFEDYLKDLGTFDNEGTAKEFKTLGAKKYAYLDEDGNKNITVSGVNKRYGVNAFNKIKDFKTGLLFDYNTSGKKSKLYNDEQPVFTMTDTQGNTETITQKHGVCLWPTTYMLDITDAFKDYIITEYNHSEFLMNL